LLIQDAEIIVMLSSVCVPVLTYRQFLPCKLIILPGTSSQLSSVPRSSRCTSWSRWPTNRSIGDVNAFYIQL